MARVSTRSLEDLLELVAFVNNPKAVADHVHKLTAVIQETEAAKKELGEIKDFIAAKEKMAEATALLTKEKETLNAKISGANKEAATIVTAAKQQADKANKDIKSREVALDALASDIAAKSKAQAYQSETIRLERIKLDSDKNELRKKAQEHADRLSSFFQAVNQVGPGN